MLARSAWRDIKSGVEVDRLWFKGEGAGGSWSPFWFDPIGSASSPEGGVKCSSPIRVSELIRQDLSVLSCFGLSFETSLSLVPSTNEQFMEARNLTGPTCPWKEMAGLCLNWGMPLSLGRGRVRTKPRFVPMYKMPLFGSMQVMDRFEACTSDFVLEPLSKWYEW